MEPWWVRRQECHETGRFGTERDGYCTRPTFARPALMLQSKAASATTEGGVGGWEEAPRGPTQPEGVALGVAVAPAASPAASPALPYSSGTISWTKASPERSPETQLQSESLSSFHRGQPHAPRDARCAPSPAVGRAP